MTNKYAYNKEKFKKIQEKINELKELCDTSIIMCSIKGEQEEVLPSVITGKGSLESKCAMLNVLFKEHPLLLIGTYTADKYSHSEEMTDDK